MKIKQEDEQIIELVNKFGPKKWSTIAQHLPGRIGKQCRERCEGRAVRFNILTQLIFGTFEKA